MLFQAFELKTNLEMYFKIVYDNNLLVFHLNG